MPELLDDAGRADVAVCDVLGHDGKWRNLAKRQLADIVPPPELPAWLEGRRLDAVAIADSANAAHAAARSTRAAILAAVFAEQQLSICGNPQMLHPRASVSSPQM